MKLKKKKPKNKKTKRLEFIQQMGILCAWKHLSRMVNMKPYHNKKSLYFEGKEQVFWVCW